jgi:hypothetical protein
VVQEDAGMGVYEEKAKVFLLISSYAFKFSNYIASLSHDMIRCLDFFVELLSIFNLVCN